MNTLLKKFREQCAGTAWNHYMDTCKRLNRSPASYEEFIASKAIRALPLPEISDKPVAYMRNRFAQSLETNGYCDGHEWLEVCNEGEQGDDGEPAFPVYAAPRQYIQQDVQKVFEENEQLKALLQKHGLSIEGHDV